jgi:nucleotide-binding universal stress UspA family protein
VTIRQGPVGSPLTGSAEGAVFRRILVAVDGSADTLEAARVAAALAALTQGRLRACSVLDTALVAAAPASHREPLRSELRQESQARLRQVRALCGRVGVPSSAVLVEGSVVDEILGAARRFRADLIALSTRGAGRVQILFGGSVAVDLVRRAPCPVLLVRRGTRVRIASRRGVPRRRARSGAGPRP